jgi:hypothetical protein
MLHTSDKKIHTHKQQRQWWLWRAVGCVAFLTLPMIAVAHDFAGASPPPDTLSGRVTVAMTAVVVVVLCVFLHYEALGYLTGLLKRIHLPMRPRILFLIFAILATHVAEIWIFGGAYYWLSLGEGQGALVASHALGLLDHIYFSAVCYTTLGLGDIVPMGAIRFLTGTEALTGFVMITWSASFTFFEMERFWKR